jgi:hypothetical protein
MHERAEPNLADDLKSLARDPNTQASALLAVGPALWRLVSNISNVDFLLEVNEEKFSMIFEFMQNYGWWILSLVGVYWIYFNWSNRKTAHDTSSWPLVPICSLIAFMFGVLLAVRATGSVPNIVTGWGGPPGACAALFDTTRLTSFKGKYKVALACGLEDATTDRLEDTNITFSKPFTIVGGGQSIVAPYRQSMTDHIKQLSDDAKRKAGFDSDKPPFPGALIVQVQTPIWHEPVLVPNDVAIEKITSLAELMRLGGKILRPQYFM